MNNPDLRGKTVVHVILFGFLLIAPTVAVFRGDNPGAVILGAVGAAALLLTRLTDLSTFEMFGLKTKLEREVRQVEVSLQQLRKVAAAFARANLHQLAMSGQMFNGILTSEKFAVRDQIVEALKEIGASQEDILRAQGLWIEVYCAILFDDIKRAVAPSMSPTALAAQTEALPQDEKRGLPNPAGLNEWISALPQASTELATLVKEYTSVWNTGGMHEPDRIPFNRLLPRTQ